MGPYIKEKIREHKMLSTLLTRIINHRETIKTRHHYVHEDEDFRIAHLNRQIKLLTEALKQIEKNFH